MGLCISKSTAVNRYRNRRMQPRTGSQSLEEMRLAARGEGHSVNRRRPHRIERLKVIGATVPLVAGESVLRVVRRELGHHAIPGDLCVDRRSRNRPDGRVALHDCGCGKSKLHRASINENVLHLDAETGKRTPHRDDDRLTDAHRVDLRRLRMTDRDCECTTLDLSVQTLAGNRGQSLGVIQPLDHDIAGKDTRAGSDRPGKGAPSDLVHACDDEDASIRELPFPRCEAAQPFDLGALPIEPLPSARERVDNAVSRVASELAQQCRKVGGGGFCKKRLHVRD